MKRSFISVLTVTMVLLFLCSCGDDTKPETSTAAVEFKRTDNEILIAVLRDADVLNPILSKSGISNTIHDILFQYLEYLNPETNQLEPQLAKSKPQIEDIVENGAVVGNKYTFELREEAVWPNGTPIIAEDYAFALKAALNPKVPAEHLRGFIESISAVEIDADNPRRFSVSTNKQYILNEEAITAGIPLMPSYHYDPKGLLADIDINDLLDSEKANALAESNPKLQEFADFFTSPEITQNPLGSGAYAFESWERGQRISLKKRADWWGSKLNSEHHFFQARLDKIIYKVITDENVAATELKAEGFDVRTQITPAVFNELRENERAKELYNFYAAPSSVYYFLYLNNQDPRLTDKRVRRALAHALDLDEVIKTVYDGGPTRANGPAYPGKTYYRKDLPPVPFDIEKAKTLLADAGWADSNDNGIVDKEIEGELLEMELDFVIRAGRKTNADMALIFQESAIKAGIKIEAVAKEGSAMNTALQTREYHIMGAGARHSPITWSPKQRFHSDSDAPGGLNKMGFHNDKADALMDKIEVTLDEEKRNELYRTFQEVIYEEQPMIFMFTSTNNIAIHKRLDAKTYSLRPGYFPQRIKLKE